MEDPGEGGGGAASVRDGQQVLRRQTAAARCGRDPVSDHMTVDGGLPAGHARFDLERQAGEVVSCAAATEQAAAGSLAGDADGIAVERVGIDEQDRIVGGAIAGAAAEHPTGNYREGRHCRCWAGTRAGFADRRPPHAGSVASSTVDSTRPPEPEPRRADLRPHDPGAVRRRWRTMRRTFTESSRPSLPTPSRDAASAVGGSESSSVAALAQSVKRYMPRYTQWMNPWRPSRQPPRRKYQRPKAATPSAPRRGP